MPIVSRLSLVIALVLAMPAYAEENVGPTGYVVKQRMVEDRKAVIATVESVHEVQARTRIAGTITTLLVKEGDHVAAGDKMAVVGDPKLAIRGQALEAHIQAAQSSFDKAKLDFARADELARKGFGTQAALDQARSALKVSENNLLAAQADKREVAQQSTEGDVLAPSAGRVLTVPLAAGSVVLSGETVATLAQENYILRLQLPERHARFLKAGDTVRIGGRGLQPDAGENLTFGTVRLVYPAIVDGRVVADVAVPDLGDYFVGERTRVYISTGQRAALPVPTADIYRRAGVSYVRLKGGTEVAVQTGQVLGDETEVLSGLQDGDVVVTP